jgi:hypothetical protein
MSLVTPSVRSSVSARPEAAQGKRATLILRPCSFASVSVSPAQAISGSVKTTAGMAAGSKATLWPAMASAATRPSCEALCASIGSPVMSPMAKIDGSAVRRCASTLTKPRASISTSVFSRPSPAEFGLRPTEISTLSKTCSGCSRLAPSSLTRIPSASSVMLVTLVLSITE